MPTPRLQEKEDWINAVGRAIVRHSKRWVASHPWAVRACGMQTSRAALHRLLLLLLYQPVQRQPMLVPAVRCPPGCSMMDRDQVDYTGY